MQDMGYERFAGPKDEESKDKPKVIDIGLYEYQYPFKFGELGYRVCGYGRKRQWLQNSWDNATSDLRGALVAACQIQPWLQQLIGLFISRPGTII